MKRARTFPHRNRPGSALVISLVFIAVFAALAAALATVSGANVHLANNFRRAGTTRASAESGLEVMRYWMSKVVLSAAPKSASTSWRPSFAASWCPRTSAIGSRATARR